ncbi:hypothetical protein U27_04428 [Candidatus Vecturithrix granuli]|uniref:Uncharacterized protein n=1 Tax=Vecturithrix granuli TaxID=1499967 RepID=A0A081BYQ6_VECG1|nr:hypothetical protein U27_04428 [Candidatus Vecturithrix granuli]
MNTIKKEEFDYQQYMREHPPDSARIQRGPVARKQRFEAARMKTAIHIDEDILEHFHEMVSEAQSCENLINQALREWLSAKTMKDLFREEIEHVLQQTFSVVQLHSQQTREGTF